MDTFCNRTVIQITFYYWPFVYIVLQESSIKIIHSVVAVYMLSVHLHPLPENVGIKCQLDGKVHANV